MAPCRVADLVLQAARRGRRKGVAVLGISVLDIKANVAKLPAAGETVLSTSVSEDLGGKGFNQAVQAALLLGGRDVEFVTRVGRDPHGNAVRAKFGALGMGTHGLSEDSRLPTGSAFIVVDAGGANTIVVNPGANDALGETDAQRAAPLFQRALVVLGQLEANPAATLAAFQLAGPDAVKILNTAPAPDLAGPGQGDASSAQAKLVRELMAQATVLCPNELEAKQLTGAADEEAAAVKLLEDYGNCAAVVVTLGPRGALVVERDGSGEARKTSLPAAEGVRAVDTVGAGDSFVGSLAAALCEGSSLVQACSLANRVAAHCVQRAGTQSAYASRAEAGWAKRPAGQPTTLPDAP